MEIFNGMTTPNIASLQVIRMREMFVVLCELVIESQCASLFEELFGR